MAQIHLTPGLTMFEAWTIAKDAGMYLISNGIDIRVSPIIPPGWREIPMCVKVTAPDRGYVCTPAQVAA